MDPRRTNTTQSDRPWCEDYWAVSGLNRETCAGCMAADQGRRCWEVSASPCCKRPRDYCAGCDVYVAYIRSCGRPQTVEVHTFDGMIMVGDIYVPAGSRLSAVINDPERDFVTITNVSIDRQYSATGSFRPVMMVNRRSISTVEPRNATVAEEDAQSCHPRFPGAGGPAARDADAPMLQQRRRAS